VYQTGDDEIWAYIPVSAVEEFIAAHGGEVERLRKELNTN